ncbi:MAG: chitobiase/beta-hexosaminidase C-terminal domain-containing protein [Fibrobacteres bacterium]|jgi:uncharacterized protein (TIGR02145 family)|nr:chitobiase/beta-hexosaminidase C-terminal domain-containing protein [Fibrobacterota bacterium]
MKHSLVALATLILAATVVPLTSCDKLTDSTKSDGNSPQDTLSPVPAVAVVEPIFSPSGGTYSASQLVTISSATSGANLYYTTDGSTPTISSMKYTAPVTVSETRTLKVIATKSGMTTSSASSATYTISTIPSSDTGTTIPWNSAVTYGSMSDADGQTYKTVTIGTQTWMAENLNYKVDNSWWYNGSADNGAKYGRLYTWMAAMNLPDSCYGGSCASLVESKHQGVCPTGWHVPSDTEWTTLTTSIGGVATAGSELNSVSGWALKSGKSQNGTDTYGFRALPAGARYSVDLSFGFAGSNASFWSSSEVDVILSWSRHLGMVSGSLFKDNSGKMNGYSVRCLKDGP